MTTIYFAKKTSVFSPNPSGNFLYTNALWESNGTAAGTFQVAAVSQSRSSVPGIRLFDSYGNKALFTPADGEPSDNLWISDGSLAGTGPIQTPAATSSNPSGVASLNGRIIYAAQGGSNYNLWSSNGTAAGTNSLGVLFGQPGIKSIADITVINGVMYFIANYQGANIAGNPNGTYAGSLWKTDGTAAGTERVGSLGTTDGIRSHLGTVSGLGTELLFWRDLSTGSNAPQLWQINGTTMSLRMAFDSGARRTGSDFTSLGNYAYFTIDDGTHGTELWKTRSSSVVNSVEPQTTLVADIALGATGSNPTSLTASNGWLFFAANDGVRGSELWKTNGGAVTTLVSDIRLGSTGSAPGSFTDVNGTLYFTADDGVHGRELWKTNGTGATRLTDFPGSSNPINLTDVNGILYFQAIDGTGKYGLFRSNGTAAGTIQIATDVDPAAGISFQKIGPVTGTAGNNTLTGPLAGDAETMRGLGGDDIYLVDNADDQVIEAVGGGNDRVATGVSYTLTAGQEIEVFTTNYAGGTGALDLTGNEFANYIIGNAGANRIDGKVGADTMQGASGNDIYLVDNAADVVLEAVGGGYDRVATGVSYALTAGQEIELFTTDNAGGTSAINLTGNQLVNSIGGNAGANTIDGRGGADTMQGLGGNDLYHVDNAGDLVFEAVGAGSDRVAASVSYVLAAGQQIEVFTTNNAAGTAAIDLTGNEFANVIAGNAGANRLDGRGGADSMQGLGGNDIYLVDNAGDQVIEAVGGGYDRVATGVSYFLAAGQEIELFTTNNAAGTSAINLTGNEFANSIGGNAGNNILNGSAGNDTLTGLGGGDTFVFNTALNPATNVDTIADFSVVDDAIALENAVFAGLGEGTLSANAFRIGAAAGDADDRIIYNNATGQLIFDSNGNAAGGATHFATLAAGLALTNADFVII